MEDFSDRLIGKLVMSAGLLKILKMGGGTGETTQWHVPLLASLSVPIEYNFTNLAPSFVAAARKRYRHYSFMRSHTHDTEKAPAPNLVGQHIVIANNAVHATHSLAESTENLRQLLRPYDILMMLEMTGMLFWVDMIFGLFDCW
jgi:hypothetical protein